MHPLHLSFEDGFSNDEVVVTFEGQEVARVSGLQSSLATALAATRDLQVPSTEGTVAVSVTASGLRATTAVDVVETPHLAVAVREGRLVLRTSAEPPQYL